MRKRSRLGRKRSKKIFRRGAQRVNRLNNARPMRGGIRL